MRKILLLSSLLASLSIAGPASAMDRYGRISTPAPAGSRAAIVDPDAGLERLAAASAGDNRGAGRHAKPPKGARSVLRNDAYLQDAFAWLDNK